MTLLFSLPQAVAAVEDGVTKMKLDEKRFRRLLNEDAMAIEKPAEGIRRFTADIVKLENIFIKRL